MASVTTTELRDSTRFARPNGSVAGEVSSRSRSLLVLLVSAGLLDAFCVALLIMRSQIGGGTALAFLVWNLFLASIPVGAAAATAWLLLRRRFVGGVVVGAVWLVFFPNAPYLITDLVHLEAVSSVPYWYDVLVYGTFAITGMLFGIVSLALVHAATSISIGRVAGACVAVLASFLCGVGVYLGRFLRWNSWDVLDDPYALLADLRAIADPIAQPRAWVVSALVGCCFLCAYLVVYALAVAMSAVWTTGRFQGNHP